MFDVTNQVNHWLQERAPGAELDADGVAGLQRDAQTVVVLEVPAGGEVCHLYAPVAPLPEEAIAPALTAALELNRFGRPLGGCWLAWDPDVHMLTLCHNLHVPATDALAFNNTLDNFIDSLDSARAMFMASPAQSDADFRATFWE